MGESNIENSGTKVRKPKKQKRKVPVIDETPDVNINQECIPKSSSEIEGKTDNLSTKPPKKAKKSKKRKLQETDTQEVVEELGDNAEIEQTKQILPKKKPKKSRKKLKQEEREQVKRENTSNQYKVRIVEYLETWKNDKQNWKFSKMTQQWIINHIYDKECLPDTLWNTTLEYFKASRGQVKKNLLDAAVKIIETDNIEDSNAESSVDSVKLSRAKDIVQNIDE